jgi:6-pyruvoyltetrahydropterin/6-carboxytetrahydropterin synthase
LLLPTKNPFLNVTKQTHAGREEVLVTFEKRRWIFPADECRLLPLINTTAELLAEWIGTELLERLAQNGSRQLGFIRLEVDECLGQSAIWEKVMD